MSSWLTNWQNQGLVGLTGQKGQGRRAILSVTNTAHQQALKQAVAMHYQDAGRIKTDLEKALGQAISRDTVKRFLKKNDYAWHRLRPTTKPFQDPIAYADGYQRWQILPLRRSDHFMGMWAN